MRRLFILASSLAVLYGGEFLQAATTATQTVTFSVSSINSISVSGNPAALNITGAVAGSNPTSVTDASTTYSVTTNQATQKITGALSTAMPSGTTLSILLAAPSGATSAGTVALTTTAQSLITAISNLAQSALSITYTFAATPAAGAISSSTTTVTFTLGP